MTSRYAVAALAGAVLCLPASAAAATDVSRVGAFENFWNPRKVEIQVGDKVRWKNREGTHSVVMKEGGQDVDSYISGDATVTSRRFKEPGTFRYVCRIHEEEGMKGKVRVEAPE
jgi:plastocyanin